MHPPIHLQILAMRMLNTEIPEYSMRGTQFYIHLASTHKHLPIHIYIYMAHIQGSNDDYQLCKKPICCYGYFGSLLYFKMLAGDILPFAPVEDTSPCLLQFTTLHTDSILLLPLHLHISCNKYAQNKRHIYDVRCLILLWNLNVRSLLIRLKFSECYCILENSFNTIHEHYIIYTIY